MAQSDISPSATAENKIDPPKATFSPGFNSAVVMAVDSMLRRAHRAQAGIQRLHDQAFVGAERSRVGIWLGLRVLSKPDDDTGTRSGESLNDDRDKFDQIEYLQTMNIQDLGPIATETIRDPYMLFFINQTYKSNMSEIELYDCTRQFWDDVSFKTRTPSSKTGKFPYPVALAIVDHVVLRAYSVAWWFPAGTTLSTRPITKPGRRFEFVGQLINDHHLVGRRLTKGGRDLPAVEKGYCYLPLRSADGQC